MCEQNGFETISNQGEKNLIFELYDLVDKIYSDSKNFRDSFRYGDEQSLQTSNQSLNSNMQLLYYFYEENRFSSTKLPERASALVNKYNEFVINFNAFANSVDRTNKESQCYAKNAESLFSEFVDLLTQTLQIIRKEMTHIQSKSQIKEENNHLQDLPIINFCPNIINNVNTSIEVDSKVSVLIDKAKEQVSELNLNNEKFQEVLQKLEELNSTVNNTNSKEQRWGKIRGVLKWLAEQSIQIADIIIPVITGII